MSKVVPSIIDIRIKATAIARECYRIEEDDQEFGDLINAASSILRNEDLSPSEREMELVMLRTFGMAAVL